MKLATYRDGSRDGQLVVVSRDLSQAHYAATAATRLQQVLDDWNFLSPQLQDLYVALNQGRARHAFAFEPRRCAAPLPRAYQLVAGAASRSDPDAAPPLLQGAGDAFLGPCDDARFASDDVDIDFDPGLAAITSDLPALASPEQALDSVRLLMLVNRWWLQRLLGAELDRGLGVVQGAPAIAFGPVAVTPDELGNAWSGGRVNLTLQSSRNAEPLAASDFGAVCPFGELIAQLACTRPVGAGTIVVAAPADGAVPGCIATLRARQGDGNSLTRWLRPGDTLQIEPAGAEGILGAISQRCI